MVCSKDKEKKKVTRRKKKTGLSTNQVVTGAVGLGIGVGIGSALIGNSMRSSRSHRITPSMPRLH